MKAQCMVSVADLDEEQIQDICEVAARDADDGELIQISNFLFKKGFTFGGTQLACEKAVALAPEAKCLQARVIRSRSSVRPRGLTNSVSFACVAPGLTGRDDAHTQTLHMLLFLEPTTHRSVPHAPDGDGQGLGNLLLTVSIRPSPLALFSFLFFFFFSSPLLIFF